MARNQAGQIETVQYYKLDAMLLNEMQKQQRLIERQQSLLEEMGGRFVEIAGADVADALVRFAISENATQLLARSGQLALDCLIIEPYTNRLIPDFVRAIIGYPR